MKIPKDHDGLKSFARDIVEQCQVSQAERRMQSRSWRQLYYSGTLFSKASKHNKCYSLIDKLTSFLYSPAEVRASIDINADEQEQFGDIAEAAGSLLNQEFNRVHAGSNCSLMFGQGVEIGLVDGCSFVRPTWRWLDQTRGVFMPHLIRASFMGVLREDLNSLDEQEAFTHSQYHTKASFERLLHGHRDKDEIIRRATAAYQPADEEIYNDTYLREIVSGGLQPISITGTPSGAMGNVQVLAAPPAPRLATEVAAELIRVDDIWVYDDDQRDWVTLRVCDPDIIIEGRYRLQNLGDIPGRHPFIKICPNEIEGYFWGRSELANVAALQEILNQRINDIDDIFRLQAKPPRSFAGFSGITAEKALALLSAGGSLTESQNAGAKVENLAPEMPVIALDYITILERFMDEAAGFSAILSGEGVDGVRAGAQAQTLIRTASPRMRDRSLIVEAQCAEFFDKCFAMAQSKNPAVYKSRKGKSFTLKQLPPGARAVVDSHTSSPAFQGDYMNMAFALAKAEAIDMPTLISMVHPPREDYLIRKAQERDEAQAQMLRDNPQLLLEDKKKKR